MTKEKHMMKALIIIPAYNESQNIIQVISELNEALSLSNYDIQYDYLIINDCSTDNLKEICINNNFKYIDLPVNLGIGGSVQTGYMFADKYKYDFAIQLDGDGQHDPKYIEDLLSPLISKQADIVIGSRFINKQGFQSSFFRRCGINFLSKLINCLCRTDIKDVTSGYRAVNTNYISYFAKSYPSDYPEPEAIIASSLNNASIIEIPVEMRARIAGTSSINFIGSIYYMIKVSIAILICRLRKEEK